MLFTSPLKALLNNEYPVWSSNKGLQRTALCADKIGAFLKAGSNQRAFPIYGCAAAEAQAVGPATSSRLHFAYRFWLMQRPDERVAHSDAISVNVVEALALGKRIDSAFERHLRK